MNLWGIQEYSLMNHCWLLMWFLTLHNRRMVVLMNQANMEMVGRWFQRLVNWKRATKKTFCVYVEGRKRYTIYFILELQFPTKKVILFSKQKKCHQLFKVTQWRQFSLFEPYSPCYCGGSHHLPGARHSIYIHKDDSFIFSLSSTSSFPQCFLRFSYTVYQQNKIRRKTFSNF